MSQPAAAATRTGSSARNAVISFGGAIAAAVFGFALTVVVGRTIGPTGSGQFFTVTGIFFVLTMGLKLGADTGLQWALPRLRALGRLGETRATVRLALLPVWVASFLAGVGLFAASGWLAPHLFGPEYAESAVMVLRIIAPLVVITPPMLVALYGTRGLGSVVPFTLINNVGVPAARPVLIVAVVALGIGAGHQLEAVIVAWSLPVVLATVAAFTLLARAVREVERCHEPISHLPPQVRQQLWRYCRPRAVSALLEIALVWADVLLVAALAGPREAGIYGAASRFVTTGTLAEAALRVALAPRISELLAKGQVHVAGRLVSIASVWITALSWPLYLVLATFSPVILVLIGPEFSDGATALSILALAMAVALSAGNVQSVLLMSGRSTWQMTNKTIALGLDIVLCLLLVPPLGMVGAAWAWASAILVDTALAVWQVRWKLGVRARVDEGDPEAPDRRTGVWQRLSRRGLALLPVALSAAVIFGGYGLVLRVSTDASLTGLVVFLATACPLYAVLLWWMRPLLGINSILPSLTKPRQR